MTTDTDWAAVWEAESEEAREMDEARREITARELEELRSLGVSVDRPAALERARADHDIMALLRGRQLRALLEVRRRKGYGFDPCGFADELRTARLAGVTP